MNTPEQHAQPRQHPWLIPLILVLLAVALRLLPGLRTIDDAYITYRYARNLLSGRGFVYNPGQPIQGTTTPLYTLLLALVGFFSGGASAPFPTIAAALNLAADACTVYLVYRIGRQSNAALAGILTAAYWAAAPFSVTFAVGGLETSFFILLQTAAVYLYVGEKYPASFLTAGLSILTRPDGLLLAGLLLLGRFWKVLKTRQLEDQSWPLNALAKELLLFSTPLLIWAVFAWMYFGSPIAHSVTAKSQAYYLPGDAAFVRLLQHYATPFLGHLTFGRYWIGIGLVLYPFLNVIAFRHYHRRTDRLLPWAVYPLLYFGAFAVANPLIFRWYLTPPLLPYAYFIFSGASILIRDIASWIRSRLPQPEKGQQAPGILFLKAALLVPLVLTARGWTLTPDHGPNRPAPRMAFIQLELFYQQAAEIVLERAGSPTSPWDSAQSPVVGAGDVGVLGYQTDLEILDLVGLNSPEPLSYYPLDPSLYTINYAVPPQLVLDELPDYLVILEVYGREGLLQLREFHDHYTLLETLPADLYGSQGMLIYSRK